MPYNSTTHLWPLTKLQFLFLFIIATGLILTETVLQEGFLNLIWPNFILILAIYITIREDVYKASLGAFVLGLLTDILNYNVIGLSSFSLLICVLLVSFLKRKVNLYNYLFLAPTVLKINLIFNYIIMSPFMALLVGYKIDLDSNLLFTLEAFSSVFAALIIFSIFNKFLFKNKMKEK